MSGAFASQLETLKVFMENMPAFSPATQKLIELSNDLNASPKDVIKAVRMDPVLTGKVFELVNSAYFNLPEKVTSLNRVVVFIGINTVKNIALSSTVAGALATENEDLKEAIKPLWKHSLATAVVAKTIAKEVGIDKKKLEECFIAGLLHDIGKIILIQAFHGNLPYEGRLSIQQERERYGLGHNEVAHAILKKWNFEDKMMVSVMHSHNPTDPEDKLSYVLNLTDYMTYKLGLNDIFGDVKKIESKPMSEDELDAMESAPEEETDEEPSSESNEKEGEKNNESEEEAPEEHIKSEGDGYLPYLATNVYEVLNSSEEKIEAALSSAEDEIKKAEMFLAV